MLLLVMKLIYFYFSTYVRASQEGGSYTSVLINQFSRQFILGVWTLCTITYFVFRPWIKLSEVIFNSKDIYYSSINVALWFFMKIYDWSWFYILYFHVSGTSSLIWMLTEFQIFEASFMKHLCDHWVNSKLSNCVTPGMYIIVYGFQFVILRMDIFTKFGRDDSYNDYLISTKFNQKFNLEGGAMKNWNIRGLRKMPCASLSYFKNA